MTDMLTNERAGDRTSGSYLADLNDQQVRMAVAPMASVTSLLLEAFGHHRGSPATWYGPVRDALTPTDNSLFAPLLGDCDFFPDCLIPRPHAFSPTFSDELDRVAATPADVLLTDIAAEGLLDSAWSRFAREPRRWLGAYVAMMHRAWSAVEPLWDRASPIMESEVTRVGSALAQGSFDVLVAELTPRANVVDGRWFIERRNDPVTVAPGMVVAPLIGGSRATFVTGWNDVVRYFAYPLPGARRLVRMRDGQRREDRLGALLGEPRAHLLRRLDGAVTAGSLAEAMNYVPSAISHHLLALERAGLIQRERVGRHVLVHRTPRGTALLDLYTTS